MTLLPANLSSNQLPNQSSTINLHLPTSQSELSLEIVLITSLTFLNHCIAYMYIPI